VALTYFDYELGIERTEQGYRIEVHRSLAGEYRLDIPLSQLRFDLDRFLADIGRPTRSLERDTRLAAATSRRGLTEALRAAGKELFETFFADEIGLSYRRSLDEAEDLGAGLRIRMRLSDVPELAQLPWEYLYDPVEADFVTRSARTPLVRYPEVPQRIHPCPISPPLRILVIVASPKNLVQLDVDQEWLRLKEALSELEQSGRVTLERLDQATWARLQERLAEEDYHIIHFIGHGDFAPETDSGALYMETAAGQGHPVTTEDLRTLFRDERGTLRLVVLNACKGARSSPGDPFAGVAQGLIRAGIPAVIAMQFAITDQAAIDFAQGFYRRIAEGSAIDYALGEVRKAIFLEGNKLEWGTPVLFLRSLDGQIFEVDKQRAAATPEDEGYPGVEADELTPGTEAAAPPVAYVNKKIVNWFVNRERQRRIFMAMLEQQLQKQIMFVAAPTYMGKTWLINWLLNKCHAERVPVAHFDFDLLARRPLDYLTMVCYASDQLGSAHFEQMTRLIEENSESLAADSEAIRIAIKAKILESFFQSLGQLSNRQVVAFLVDAYEKVGGDAREGDDAREWTMELLFQIRADKLPQVLLVVAGQEVPAVDLEDFETFLVPVELEALQCEDVAEYLELRGVMDLDPQTIYARARGNPRQVSILVEEALLGL
jgi:hypothetical protein